MARASSWVLLLCVLTLALSCGFSSADSQSCSGNGGEWVGGGRQGGEREEGRGRRGEGGEREEGMVHSLNLCGCACSCHIVLTGFDP